MGDKKDTKPRDPMLDALNAWDGSTRIWNPAGAVDIQGREVVGVYAGKVVSGELIRVEEWETENGPARVAVIADDTDGQETCIFINSVTLSKAWEDNRPSKGDRIGVAFGGKEVGKGGRTYNRYKLLVQRCVFKRDPAEVEPGDVDYATGEILSKRNDPFAKG